LLFALLADGFWSALAARALTGIGWAGTYMTGLKLLADKVDEKQMSRATAAMRRASGFRERCRLLLPASSPIHLAGARRSSSHASAPHWRASSSRWQLRDRQSPQVRRNRFVRCSTSGLCSRNARRWLMPSRIASILWK